MTYRTELDNITESDIYSLILFCLYKCTELPEYSPLSQLAYILDKDNLLKLCEFYGGMTIRVPKISEIEELLLGLLVFQKVDIEGKPLKETLLSMRHAYGSDIEIKKHYDIMKNILKEYNFNSGRCNNE